MKNNIIIIRIIFSLMLLGTIVFFPGFVVVLGACIGMFLFKNYFESLAVLILFDGLYSFGGSALHAGRYVMLGIVVFLVVQYLKKHLTWYEK